MGRDGGEGTSLPPPPCTPQRQSEEKEMVKMERERSANLLGRNWGEGICLPPSPPYFKALKDQTFSTDFLIPLPTLILRVRAEFNTLFRQSFRRG